MSEYEVLNAYTRIKFHFDPKSQNTYKNTEHYPSKTVETNRKFVDVHFLMKINDLQKCSLFFVWLFYSKNNTLPKNNMRALYTSDSFKKFKESLYNYADTLEREFTLAYNTKSFESFKQLMFKNKLSGVTIWVLLNTRFKNNKNVITESNVFSSIWFNIESLMKFINVDKDIIRNYVRRIET